MVLKSGSGWGLVGSVRCEVACRDEVVVVTAVLGPGGGVGVGAAGCGRTISPQVLGRGGRSAAELRGGRERSRPPWVTSVSAEFCRSGTQQSG